MSLRTGLRLAPRRPSGLPLGAVVFATTQAADVGTTFVGLTSVAGVWEANPLVAAVIAVLGVPAGLLAVSVPVTVAVVVATEVGARRVGGPDRRWASVVRLLGYGPLSAFNVAVVAHNLAVIGAV